MNASREINKLMEVWERPHRGAVAAGIVQGGKIVFRKDVGFANIEHAVRAHAGTRFQIASLSKQFTAALAVKLSDAGRLNLDEDVRAVGNLLSHYSRAITLRQMLGHTSGLIDTFDVLAFAGAHIETPVSTELVNQIYGNQRHLNFPTGEGFVYSNGGFETAASIIEEMAGDSLGDLLKQYLFDPIGMANTLHVRRDNTIVANEADGYLIENGMPKRGRHGVPFNGGSGILSTLDDMLCWENFLLDPAASGRLLSRLEAPATLANGAESFYGLGTYIDRWNGRKISGHGGLLPGFKASVVRCSDADTSVVVLSNTSDFDANELSRRLLGLAVLGEDIVQPAEDLDIKPGRYFEERKNELFEVIQEGGRAWALYHGWRVPLRRTSDNRAIEFDDPLLHGQIGGNGCSRLTEWGKEWDLRFIQPGISPTEGIERFAGVFSRKEIPTKLFFQPLSSGLHLEISGYFGSAEYSLQRVDRDLFFARSRLDNWMPFEMLIHFMADDAGSIPMIKVTTDRTKAIEFHRVN